ncbi:hypothetical protein JAAARDRAFT_198078 [Jaapia argillacea MUCL 33604]|uniref:Uncharacterized protein n=1 Tax=Jaapia argillacea MUCL 33604 TaxID=933084 RepID=A0A067PN65_9AGAM|nr:hypothetical protein JAAARDRAFT_198078 [Jaapia argillacea MUCL 33604]
MSLGNPHKTNLITAIRASFNTPRFTTDDYSPKGVQWVTIAGCGLGPHFPRVRGLLTSVERNALGQWEPSDWAIYPDWYDESKPWLSYIPQRSRALSPGWLWRYHETADHNLRPGEQDTTLFKFKPGVRIACHDDVMRVETLLYEILPHIRKLDNNFPLPNLAFLDGRYASTDKAMARLWDCCHEALAKLGFVCFHLRSLPEWQALNWLMPDFVEIVSNLGLADEAPVQGAVIDILGINMPFIMVLQLLKHSVPVTYIWSDEERAVAVAKPTWLQWEPEHNGAKSAGAIQTELNAKFLQTKKQAKQAKSCYYRKRAKKQKPASQQSSQPKLSKAEKRRLKDEREVQAACNSDDTALATEGDPQASKEAQEALESTPPDDWYHIPLFVPASEMDVDIDPTPNTDKPRAPSWSPTRMDNVQSQSSVPETPPRTRSPSPRPQSPMRVDPTSSVKNHTMLRLLFIFLVISTLLADI